MMQEGIEQRWTDRSVFTAATAVCLSLTVCKVILSLCFEFLPPNPVEIDANWSSNCHYTTEYCRVVNPRGTNASSIFKVPVLGSLAS